MKRSEACSACKVRPRRGPKQRYCKVCNAAKSRQYRQDAKNAFADLERKVRELTEALSR